MNILFYEVDNKVDEKSKFSDGVDALTRKSQALFFQIFKSCAWQALHKTK